MAQDPEGADAGGADAAPGGAARKARKANPLANRIKRLMQTDEDVGKIAQASPALIGSALRHAPALISLALRHAVRAQQDMHRTSIG